MIFDDMDTFLRARGIDAEDSYDFGLWWWDGPAGGSGQYRLTWIGPARRDGMHRPGELYLIRLNPASVKVMAGAAIVQAGEPAGLVEVVALVDPVAGKKPLEHGIDGHVETLLEGWGEACGSDRSVQWIRDRILDHVRAGTTGVYGVEQIPTLDMEARVEARGMA